MTSNVLINLAIWLSQWPFREGCGATSRQGSSTSAAQTGDGLQAGATAVANATQSVQTAVVGGETITYAPQFTVPASADEGANLIPNIEDPEAVDAQTVCPGYKASNVKRSAQGLSASLSIAGEQCNVYGNDINELTLTVEYQSDDRLSINISPANYDSSNASHYFLPEWLVPRPGLESDANMTSSTNDLQFVWGNDPTFYIRVIRRSTGDVVFDTEGTVLVYEDQFIEFVTALPEDYNWQGLGEHIHSLRLGNNYTATSYAVDAGNPIDRNLYGLQPFYLDTRYYEVDEDGEMTLATSNDTDVDNEYVSYSHGVFWRNAHGQEVLLRSENSTFRALGGNIDLFFFDGPKPADVTKQYLDGAIGLPAMQQYFTFGYHQCRWGYKNWTMLQGIVDDFRHFDIPLENIWVDIDYMFQYRDFTTDNNTFSVSQGRDFLGRLHDDHQHFIPIVDSAIYIPDPDNATDAYDTYTRGKDADVWMLTAEGKEYIGAVWPGYTVFPDWHTENSVPWWTEELKLWHEEVAYSGIWIDMSEVSSFCIGSCGTGNLSLQPVHPPFLLPGEPGNLVLGYPEGFNLTNATQAASAASASSSQAAASSTSSASDDYLRTRPTPGVRNVDHPPYVINSQTGDLATHAVSPNATHHTGIEEYDVHNLWGHQILNATYQGLLEVFPGKRPFIIGRSQFAGSGKWAGHWGGDNVSKWFVMYFSIPQALSYSLFGIPMFGTDACGFDGNTDEELCNRWMQLAAFFPFYRNHNTLSAAPQEPYRWESVMDATKKAINIRYTILPYIYTLFQEAHTTGSTVMRALSWEFPNDPQLKNVDRQFMLGDSIMIIPVLAQGATSVQGVFPGIGKGEVWYDWYTHTAVDAAPGENKTIEAPLSHIPVYVRGGSILPEQEPGYTTYECRRNPWSVLVALSQEGSASGELYVDDGESVDPDETLWVEFAASEGELYASSRGSYVDSNALANITIMGVESYGGNATLNGKGVGSYIIYDQASKCLTVTGLDNMTSGGAWSADWVLKWA